MRIKKLLGITCLSVLTGDIFNINTNAFSRSFYFKIFQKIADSEFLKRKNIENIERRLKNWIEFVENLKKQKNDIMNIPYSVASEIDLLDKLLSDVSITC